MTPENPEALIDSHRPLFPIGSLLKTGKSETSPIGCRVRRTYHDLPIHKGGDETCRPCTLMAASDQSRRSALDYLVRGTLLNAPRFRAARVCTHMFNKRVRNITKHTLAFQCRPEIHARSVKFIVFIADHPGRRCVQSEMCPHPSRNSNRTPLGVRYLGCERDHGNAHPPLGPAYCSSD